ncbi:MAG TPA: 6-carboxytetrahydropterin synthase [Gemmatimonadales bacterium]|jgi:6-pyruvoyltetrahydropterin/6-carboxytetrahydropterin synthase|nr:6-carboxytetrahydropterin synthase [Gemmatimonadales bacterium]
MLVTLTRTVGFRATHRYWIPEWSAERNREKFGRATEEHAHQYRCAVKVSGAADPETDMIVDLPALDRILQEEVVARFGGKFLNHDAPEFAQGGMLPSCEALARLCFSRIAARVPEGITLQGVRIAEDAELSAECTAESGQ